MDMIKNSLYNAQEVDKQESSNDQQVYERREIPENDSTWCT